MANRGKAPTNNIPSKLGEILTLIQSKPKYPTLQHAEYWEQYSEEERNNIYKDSKNLLPSGVWTFDSDTGTPYTAEEQQKIIAELTKRWFVGAYDTLSLDKVSQMFYDFWQYDERLVPTKFKYLFLKHKFYGLPQGTKNINKMVLYLVAPFTDYSFNELIQVASDDKMKLSSQPRSKTPYRPNFYQPEQYQQNNTVVSQQLSSKYQPLETPQKTDKTSMFQPLTQTQSRDHTMSQATVNQGNTMLADDSELIKIIQEKIFEEGARAFTNAGISREELSAILNGQEPKLSSGYKLADALGIEIDDLLELASRTWNNS